jgi:hypothetical protein
MKCAFIIAAAFWGVCGSAWSHGKAHQHGVLSLDIAVDVTQISVVMNAPLDNFVGFERAPLNDAERKRVDAAIQRLRAADVQFVVDPQAQCRLTHVKLTSSVLGLGTKGMSAAKGDHADIDAVFEFTCANARLAKHLDVGLFEAFPGMKRIDVQVAAGKGQFKQTLKRPFKRISLQREQGNTGD